MAKISLRQAAIDDLNEIWIYTCVTWSEKQADQYYAALEFACLQIARNPEIGKAYEGITKNLLGLRAGKHILFYQITAKNHIEVLRILHESMDLKNRLTE